EPDLIDAVSVKVERKEGGEPHPRHDSATEVLFPEYLPVLSHHRQLEGALGIEEHLEIRVDVEILSIGDDNAARLVGAQGHGCGPELPHPSIERDFEDGLQIVFVGVYRHRNGHEQQGEDYRGPLAHQRNHQSATIITSCSGLKLRYP